MSNQFVKVTVFQQIAPAPSGLQEMGAFVSQGGTNTAPGARTLLRQLSDLTSVLNGAKALTSITWTGSVATATATSPHGFTIADTVELTIAGAVAAGYNGTFPCTITGASTFTYPLASNPGSETVPGTYTVEDVAELLAMATTFFAQGSSQGAYVLELGAGDANDGVAFLTTWIEENPGIFYSYLVPRYWDANANFLTMLGNFNALAAKTYFFVTTTLATYQYYLATMKCVDMMIEAPTYSVWPANVLTALSWNDGVGTATTTSAHGIVPGNTFQLTGSLPAGWNGYFVALAGTGGSSIVFAVAANPGNETQLGSLVASGYASTGVPATEFSHAGDFYVTLNWNPSSTNKVTPLNFAYLNGVTPFPINGNASLLSTLNDANVSVVGTGAQGGISNTLLIGGNTADGNPFNYWYSVDWAQVTGQLNVTAAAINGSNNPTNPLDYDQNGINSLQQVLATTMTTGISYGLVLNPVKLTTLSAAQLVQALDAGTYDGYTVVNADPFTSYVAENPDDYAEGTYNGLSTYYTPLRGFAEIGFSITVSDFAS
jgi:hypothetical protein